MEIILFVMKELQPVSIWGQTKKIEMKSSLFFVTVPIVERVD